MEKTIQIMAGHLLQLLIIALAVQNIKVYGQFVNITILQNAVEKGAVCLDGSPAGYHYSPGFGDGTNNWLVYLPGGGWCGSPQGCVQRVQTQPYIASTINITVTYFDGILSSVQEYNPDFYNWNRVMIRYCDGSSFIGDVEAVDPATNLHYRGSTIFGAVVEELLTKGLQNAQNAILAGNSAGGLATILNCDRFRALVPNAIRLKCISDSGFFIRAKELPFAYGREAWFANVVATHGVTIFLPKSCTLRMDPGLVSFNLRPNPADEPGWANCINAAQTCTPAQFQLIKDFRKNFLETLKNVGDNPLRGLFINSCYIHDYLWAHQRWNFEGSPRLDNMTIAQAFSDWYFDRSSVKLIDTQTDYPLDCHLPNQ